MKDNKNNEFKGNSGGEVFSWIAIFICMFAFWPVGLILLLKKLSAYAKTSKHSDTWTSTQSQPKSTQSQPTKSSASKKNSRKEKKKQKQKLDRKSGKFVSTILLLISIALFIIGANTIVDAARDMSLYGIDRWFDLGMGAFYFLGGLISFFSRNISVRRMSRFKQYYAFVGGRGVVPIPDIAKTSGASVKSVRRDLQAMIDSGYLGNTAYIDNELDSLVLSAEAAEAVRQAAKAAQEPVRTAAEKTENQYMAVILELRALNETIADIAISDKIDRIEELTAKIFRIVEENPAKLSQIRRFMSYYLPTTLKLLHSYATLEKQGIKGENITAAKENIDRILDTLAIGFEQQLDQLFKSDVIDIGADINVLENMMQQDGLTGEKSEFRTLESN